MPDAPVWTTEGGAAPINAEPLEMVYTREAGWSATYRANGRAAEIKAEADAKIAAGWSPVRIMSKSGGDMHALTAESSAIDPATGAPAVTPDNFITNVWNILGNELEKDLWEKPEIQYIMEAVKAQGGTTAGVHNAVVLRSAIDAYIRGNTTFAYKDTAGTDYEINLTMTEILTLATAATTLAPGTVHAFDVLNLIGLIGALISGVEKFPVSQYVLEHTATGPTNSSLRGVTANTNRVHTRSYMLNVAGVPQNKLDAIPDGVYMEKTPTVTTDGDKLTVKTQWWWAETWNIFALGTAIDG
jgi:hypothetical protein